MEESLVSLVHLDYFILLSFVLFCFTICMYHILYLKKIGVRTQHEQIQGAMKPFAKMNSMKYYL